MPYYAETGQKECAVYKLDVSAEQGALETEITGCHQEHCSASLRLLDGFVEIVAGTCLYIKKAGCEDVVFDQPTNVHIDQLT